MRAKILAFLTVFHFLILGGVYAADTTSNQSASIKEDFKQAGHEMKEGFKTTGHGIKKGAKKTGRAFKQGGKSFKNEITK